MPRILFPRQGDLPGENMVGAEARENGHGPLQAEPEQAGPRQQNQ